MKQQIWERFLETGDPMTYLEFCQARAAGR